MLLAKSEVDLFAFLANFLHFCINFQHLCKLLVSYYTFQYQEKCTQVSKGIAISQLIYQRLKQLLLIVKPSNLLFNIKFFFIHFFFPLGMFIFIRQQTIVAWLYFLKFTWMDMQSNRLWYTTRTRRRLFKRPTMDVCVVAAAGVTVEGFYTTSHQGQ